jgi:hypothetical protein
MQPGCDCTGTGPPRLEIDAVLRNSSKIERARQQASRTQVKHSLEDDSNWRLYKNAASKSDTAGSSCASNVIGQQQGKVRLQHLRDHHDHSSGTRMAEMSLVE